MLTFIDCSFLLFKDLECPNRQLWKRDACRLEVIPYQDFAFAYTEPLRKRGKLGIERVVSE